jgi:hypothetical protein
MVTAAGRGLVDSPSTGFRAPGPAGRVQNGGEPAATGSGVHELLASPADARLSRVTFAVA